MGPSDVWAGAAVAAAVVSGGVVRRAGLLERLDGAARVVEVAAPAGSGKTVLLRSWIGESGLADRAGWVQVQRGEGDPQRFWISVADALLGTAARALSLRPRPWTLGQGESAVTTFVRRQLTPPAATIQGQGHIRLPERTPEMDLDV